MKEKEEKQTRESHIVTKKKQENTTKKNNNYKEKPRKKTNKYTYIHILYNINEKKRTKTHTARNECVL